MRRLALAFTVLAPGLSVLPAHANDPAPVVEAVIDPAHTARTIYPPAEALLRKAGSAEITCNISADGFAESCTVLNATAPDFGLSAQQMAMTSEFLPTYSDQKRVASIWHHTVRFAFSSNTKPTAPTLDTGHIASPIYPPAATAHNITGRISVKCHVDVQGIAHDCEAGAGPEILRQSSISYFTLAHFLPAVVDGKPVDATFAGSLDWTLDNNKDNGFN